MIHRLLVIANSRSIASGLSVVPFDPHPWHRQEQHRCLQLLRLHQACISLTSRFFVRFLSSLFNNLTRKFNRNTRRRSTPNAKPCQFADRRTVYTPPRHIPRSGDNIRGWGVHRESRRASLVFFLRPTLLDKHGLRTPWKHRPPSFERCESPRTRAPVP
jgi:hypothetical protein